MAYSLTHTRIRYLSVIADAVFPPPLLLPIIPVVRTDEHCMLFSVGPKVMSTALGGGGLRGLSRCRDVWLPHAMAAPIHDMAAPIHAMAAPIHVTRPTIRNGPVSVQTRRLLWDSKSAGLARPEGRGHMNKGIV